MAVQSAGRGNPLHPLLLLALQHLVLLQLAPLLYAAPSLEAAPLRHAGAASQHTHCEKTHCGSCVDDI